MKLKRLFPTPYDFIPEVVLGLGLLVFFIDEADPALSAFKSSRAIALMAIGGLAWIALRVGLARFSRGAPLRIGVLLIGAIGALAVIVVPAYRDKTVVEAFPLAAATPSTAPPSAAASAPTPPPVGSNPTAAPAAPTTTPAAPVRLREGNFRGIDHRASGSVVFYRSPVGASVVGLEDIDIQPGPDYDVYLVPGANKRDRSGGVRLDDLRGNKGTQYYEVPSPVDLSVGEWTLLVWCQTFGVPVANATPLLEGSSTLGTRGG